MYSKEEAHSQIATLVERFLEQLPSYKKAITTKRLPEGILRIESLIKENV
jgi:hypothetical protein